MDEIIYINRVRLKPEIRLIHINQRLRVIFYDPLQILRLYQVAGRHGGTCDNDHFRRILFRLFHQVINIVIALVSVFMEPVKRFMAKPVINYAWIIAPMGKGEQNAVIFPDHDGHDAFNQFRPAVMQNDILIFEPILIGNGYAQVIQLLRII